MKYPHTLAVLTLAALLSACGGGQEPDRMPQGVHNLVSAMHAQQSGASPNRRALALSAVGAKEVLDWAEYKYAGTFPKGPASFALDYQGVTYTVRAYPNGNYLGITEDGGIYGLGPFTNFDLRGFGRVPDFAAQVQADSCFVYPGTCPESPPSQPLNVCTMPSSEALRIGNRYSLQYVVSQTGGTPASGEYSIEGQVAQHIPFEGQSAVQFAFTASTTSTAAGVTSTSSTRGNTYAQEAANGLTLLLGDEIETDLRSPQGNSIFTVKTSNKPAYLNSEFTLQPGQSLTRTLGSRVTTSTLVNGVPLPPQTNDQSQTETISFEARENITVQGRSYDTCRYREVVSGSNQATTQWYLVGKGLPVRTLSQTGDSVETTELKSGSYNNVPL
jgi:hypothetical protein